MHEILAAITTLALLTLLQAVLGFDNLLYISLESKRVPPDQQHKVRQLGIGLAVGLRIILLFVVVHAIDYFQEPFWSPHIASIVKAAFNGHSLIVLFGGMFIIYTAIKEIFHMLAAHGEHHERQHKKVEKSGAVITRIALMNLVFSFDSILSAIALTGKMEHAFLVMATSIIISGALMIWLADHVSEFLQKNRMYEVLGLFVLFIVGIMLVSEGAHLAHLAFFGHEIHAMTKPTFYFVLTVLILVDIVQGRYQKRLLAEQEARKAAAEAATADA